MVCLAFSSIPLAFCFLLFLFVRSDFCLANVKYSIRREFWWRSRISYLTGRWPFENNTLCAFNVLRVVAVTYMLFCFKFILGLCWWQTLSRLFTRIGLYLPALQVAIAYRWSRLHPNASVHVYVLNVPAPWYPWAFLALDFVVSGPVQAAVDLTGILGAHLHLFLTEEWPRHGGRRFGTPSWFRNLFPRDTSSAPGLRPGAQDRTFGTVIPPRDTPPNTGTSSSVFGRGTGNFRGQGHRLGWIRYQGFMASIIWWIMILASERYELSSGSLHFLEKSLYLNRRHVLLNYNFNSPP